MVRSVLFACNMNSVRSPMAAALLRAQAGAELAVDSAGVWEGGPDPFVEIVLAEIGVAADGGGPKTMRQLDLAKFDIAIVLTPEAAGEARRYLPRERIEYWPIDNPSEVYGGREEILAAYRAVRDELQRRLAARFPRPQQAT
jgi:protein-tyrosine-phosphatase